MYSSRILELEFHSERDWICYNTVIAGSSNLPRQIMVRLYILKSKTGKYYIGITALLLIKRLKKHNNGEVYSTKFLRPWQIIHNEEYTNYKDARVREKQIKNWHGGNAFKKLIANAAGSSNGRTTDSESVYHGPNPCPAALAGSSS